MIIEYLVSVDEILLRSPYSSILNEGDMQDESGQRYHKVYRLGYLGSGGVPDWKRFGERSGKFYNIECLAVALAGDYRKESLKSKDNYLHILPGNLEREDSAFIEFNITSLTPSEHSFSRPFNESELRTLYKYLYNLIII